MSNSQLDSELTKAPNHHILTLDHPSYPTLLKEIPDPPKKLYITGNPLILNQPQCAILSSCNPTITGREIAQEMAEKPVQAGFYISSGLVLGIDARTSHRGALKAGGQTIAVLGSSLTNIYPRRHHRLAEKISQKGAPPLRIPPSHAAASQQLPSPQSHHRRVKPRHARCRSYPRLGFSDHREIKPPNRTEKFSPSEGQSEIPFLTGAMLSPKRVLNWLIL